MPQKIKQFSIDENAKRSNAWTKVQIRGNSTNQQKNKIEENNNKKMQIFFLCSYLVLFYLSNWESVEQFVFSVYFIFDLIGEIWQWQSGSFHDIQRKLLSHTFFALDMRVKRFFFFVYMVSSFNSYKINHKNCILFLLQSCQHQH